MKKIRAFILAIAVLTTIFAHLPGAVNNENLQKTDTAAAQTATLSDAKTEKTVTYIGNKNTKKFHLPDCYTLPKEKNRVYIPSRESAIRMNFRPCKNCNP